ncbi:acyltransferase [Formosa sp. 3Alg 14/1]|uniref:acyltransferase n=1 Tax=Formosa sp. 3Alg 14/1 TaxID=3382190 RepID=UPI0039BDC6B9
MNISKKNRSVYYRLSRISYFITKVKLKFLYNDCITVGKNFKAKGLDFQLHPENSQITFGDNIQIREDAVFRLGKNSKIEIGNGFFANKGMSLNAMGSISIGENTIFGEDVKLYDHNHGYKDTLTPIKDQPYSIGTVEIGSNCWIGSNVVILKNVKIGNDCIIGANCLVFKDVNDGEIIKAK